MARRKAGGGVAFVVTGHKAIDRKLRRLEPKIARKVLRKGLRAGQKVVQSEAKRRAPRGPTGNLRRAVRVRAGKARRRGIIRLVTIIGAGWFKGPTFYAGMVEYGTKYQRAQHFMKETYRRVRRRARKAAIRAIGSEVKSILRGG